MIQSVLNLYAARLSIQVATSTMPSTRSSTRKKQTTLSLTPLASSSPSEAAANIGSRHAAVQYSGSSHRSKTHTAAMDTEKSPSPSRRPSLRSRRFEQQSNIRTSLQALLLPAYGTRLRTGLQSPGTSSQLQQVDAGYSIQIFHRQIFLSS